ncbi:uncharacterized protein TCAP_07176 [Tolypocladium capitatum]|uniref:Uncharacterized protein n=1 Tax=Tolypocladium capitatum TaxID=45235 RepID=A0A2K3Q3V0_9HYPO|nr:uncharacterized protein TCAP_07176 [Tolypocladium capitatum]
MVSSKSSYKRRQGSGGKSNRRDEETRGKPDDTSDSCTTISLTIYIFRGQPDVYYNRHVLIYFTSPDKPNFHETVHTQRDDDKSPWRVDQIHNRTDWFMSVTYLTHVNAGTVQVWSGQEMVPVNIVAATPVEGRESDGDWNCQKFVLEGLQALVYHGFQTQEWYDFVEGELADQLIDGAVA